MAIDRDEVRRIARLANLELDPERLEPFCAQLESILDYVAVLEGLECGPIEPARGGGDSRSALREDDEKEGLTVEQALSNAPDAAAGHFRVPQVLVE